MSEGLIVVDVQNDFVGGVLAVGGGEAVVAAANAAASGRAWAARVYTQDYHPADHCSFAAAPAMRHMSWPAHCVAGTWGAELAAGLEVPADAVRVRKGTDAAREALSAFDGTDLAAQLRARGVVRVAVCGLALDYCVRATALDAVAAGFGACVLLGATRAVDPAAVPAVLADLAARGVQVQP